MNQPHFNLTANVDITNWQALARQNNWSIHPAMVYLMSAAANAVPQFRWRIRANEIVEHSVVHPSFSVTTEVANVFSFCEVKFDNEPNIFLERAARKIAEMATKPSFSDEPGRDDLLFMSSIPWVQFTGMQHAMHCPAEDSVPRITWGKFFEENGRTKMPLCVQAHHALVDGRDMGAFFMKVDSLIKGVYRT